MKVGLELFQKLGQEGRPLDERGDEDVLVLGVQAVAVGAEPVEGRDAEPGGDRGV